LIKNKQKLRIYGICACALIHSKFDHSRHQRITLLFIIRILNSKYLNDDDDEGESGSKHTHKHTHRRDAICLFQTASEERKRENNLHKALSNRGKEKKWIFRQNLVELVKEEKKMRQREQEEERYHSCVYVYSIEVTIIPKNKKKKNRQQHYSINK